MLTGDKPYDADDLRHFLAAQGTIAVISPMQNRIEHRLTKPSLPWTNGQVRG
jgi:hypothetical protein